MAPDRLDAVGIVMHLMQIESVGMSQDHFSTQSATYVRYRPTYPPELFDWLVGHVFERHLVWDCACGSGQATLSLAERFDRVIATDLSESQLAFAPKVPNVEWRQAIAEASKLESRSVDLIVVAQALHWFDLPRFWHECQWVLKTDGVIAAWCYGVAEFSDRSVGELCDEFYRVRLADYWPPERRIVEAGYGVLGFPFDEIIAPNFGLRAEWSVDELMGYFSSWSATERFRRSTGVDPVQALRTNMAQLSIQETIQVHWPLSVRVGRFVV